MRLSVEGVGNVKSVLNVSIDSENGELTRWRGVIVD